MASSPMFLFAAEFLDAHEMHIGYERYLLSGQSHDQMLERARQTAIGSDLARNCRTIEIRLLDSRDSDEVAASDEWVHGA